MDGWGDHPVPLSKNGAITKFVTQNPMIYITAARTRRRFYPGRRLQVPSTVWYSFSNIFSLDVTGDSFYFIASRMLSEHIKFPLVDSSNWWIFRGNGALPFCKNKKKARMFFRLHEGWPATTTFSDMPYTLAAD